jgi:hypothetical protein
MKLDKLEQLAKAATPGPWEWERDSGDGLITTTKPPHPVITPATHGYENGSVLIDAADAAFIAAFSPDVVLKLIAVARAATEWAMSDGQNVTSILQALSALEG